MKRVFHRRTGSAASARVKDGAGSVQGPLVVESAGSDSYGRQQAAEAATPSAGVGEAGRTGTTAETAEEEDPDTCEQSGDRDILLRTLERLAERSDAPSQARAAAAALVTSAAAGDVSYRDARHMAALLDWAGRQEAGERHSLADSTRTTLFRMFRELAMKNGARAQNAPSIAFDLSGEGFACLQVPDVVARDSWGSRTGSGSGSSLASLGHGPKVWPPPDGYSVSIWFRVDKFEAKAERDALYRDCFISKKCVHCLRSLADERMLKCSHAGCRVCIDALMSAGGECLVCNPPSFYLFRLRSGDGKSVSEAFLRGGKVYMRTSAGNHQATQFHHAAITPGKWYHAVILHSKQRFQSSSVALYLNGVLQETVKCSYPSGIVLGQPLGGVIGVPAQVRRRSSTLLRMGPFYLIEDALSAPVINALYAAGPSYDKLFFGTTGNADVRVALDHLQLPNLAMLDEYLRDPVQALIESVDTERIAKSSLIRGGLTLASAASATAAAIVHDIKWSGSWFSRIPSAAPCISIPVASEKVLLAFSPSKAIGRDPLLVPSGKLDGRPVSQAMGGAGALSMPYASMADMMFELCGSGCQLAYKLLHEATTSGEVEISLRVLEMLMNGHPGNLAAMENEHGYGIINSFLHRKATLLNSSCLRILFSIVGVDVNQDSSLEGEPEGRVETKSIITNMQALQHFILDFSLWRKAERGTRKQLFVALYSTLVAVEDDSALERNRVQLQSASFLKQLLQVLLEASVDFDVLQVIADLILVCLTTYRGSAAEDNFAEVASFLTSTLSPSFGRSVSVLESPRALDLGGRDSPRRGISKHSSNRRPKHDDPVASLGLSPRGALVRRRNGSLGLETSVFEYVQQDDIAGAADLNDDDCHDLDSTSIAARESAVAIVQNMLLDVLLRAAQKLDLKGSRDGEDANSTFSTNETVTEGSHAEGGNTHEHVSSSTSLSTSGTRMQLPTTGRLSGFRKVLSPRWVSHFLFSSPWHSSGHSPILHPTTTLRALKLFGTLAKRHSYEAVCRREHYYRLLAHGLPCRPNQLGSGTAAASFPLQDAWYALLCMILGTPVDGLPHQINFDPYYLSKDFDGNIRRNILTNPSMLTVMLTVIRRYYNDPVAIASLPRLSDPRSWSAYDIPAGGSGDKIAGEDSKDPAHHHHEAALEFVTYLYEKMPCIRGMLASSSGERFRHELLDELSLIACAAARSRVEHKYAPKKSTVVRALLRQKKEANLYEFTLCRVALAEEAAAESGSSIEDPFAHPVADRALKLIEVILTNIILDSSSGSEIVEGFFENAVAAGGGLCPPLHAGLSVRFHAIILSRLVDQVGRRLRGENVLADHKAFGFNCREFLRLAVKKMQCWQRAQHGDGCPVVFSCCEAYHFSGGQFLLLNLALFVLAETSVGIAGSTVATGSGSSASASFSVMLSEKLAKGKKKRPLRNLLGRIGLPRSAELEALTSELFSTLNAVILHILNSHRVLVSDTELEAALQQIHAYREVVLGSRNSLNKDFFVCLCRGLLQLLMDASAPRLQDAAAHLWTDLMFFQRSFMTSLLTVEIRRAGASPYSINLMKNGFNVLLGHHSVKEPSASSRGGADGDRSAVDKLTKWLQVVGPPLRELENDLDSVFMKRAMELTEFIGDAWAASHKTAAHQMSKFAKRFEARLAWSHEVLRNNMDALRAAQQKEFRHQLKWHQDYVDRQKYSLRQLETVQEHFLRAVVDSNGERSYGPSGRTLSQTPIKFEATERRNTRLDFTEGPYRMRKRMTVHSPSDQAVVAAAKKGDNDVNRDNNCDREGDSSGSRYNDDHPRLRTPTRSSSSLRLSRRRYSADDIDIFRGEMDQSPTSRSFQKNSSEAFLTRQSDVSSSARWMESARRFSNARTAPQSLHLFSSGDSYTSDDISLSDGAFSDGVDSQNLTSGLTRGVGESDDGIFFDKDDDLVDEKLRPLLIPGDDIEDIHDCLRIDGMDSCPGVFMLCSDRVYIVDNYQQVVQRTLPPLLASGNEAPHRQIRVTEVAKGCTTRLERRLGLHNRVALMRGESSSETATLACTGYDNRIQSAVPRGEPSSHQCLYWAYEDVMELHKRRYQLQHIAIELFANDGRNYLVR